MATTPYANVFPVARVGGVIYANQTVMPAAEGDLITPANAGLANVDPFPVDFNSSILAVVEFSTAGNIINNTSYVVMQTDLGDGTWIDLAWCTWTGTGATAVFGLAAGAFAGNAFQQSRSVGTAPTPANGSVQCPLGGRIRFVGKATVNTSPGSSSLGPAANNEVIVTILYKLVGLR